jgi:hypothetical protein
MIAVYGHFTSGGIEDNIESTLPPVFSPHPELVPLICPTCQMVPLASHLPATGRLLCMGLFSIF